MVALIFSVTLFGAKLQGESAIRDTPVTFETRASRIENILPELSKASGTQLLFSPQLRDAVLVMKVKDVPLRSLMNHIAKSAKAEWKQETDGWRLIRTPTFLADLEKQHAIRVEKRFQTALDDLKKRFEKAGAIDNAKAAVIAAQIKSAFDNRANREATDESDHRFAGAIEMSLPGPRLATQIALTIPAATYAAAPLGTPNVFTLKPNRLQKELSKDVALYLSAYSKSAKLLQTYLPNGVPYRAGMPVNIYQIYRMLSESDVTASRVHFIVTRYPPGSSAYIKLKVSNEKGKIIDQSELLMLDVTGEATADKLPLGERADEPIPLSDSSRKWIDIVRRVNRGQPEGTVPEFQKLLTDSMTQEPAQYLYSDLILGLAKASGRNIVASTSVGRGDLSSFGVAELPPTSDRFVRFIQSSYAELSIQSEEKFFRIEPADWIESQMYCIDSRVRARFRSKAARQIGFDDLATLAASVNAVQGFGTELRLVRALSPKSGVPESYQFQLLRILGSMTLEQRKGAESELGLPWPGLTPGQQNGIFQLMFANERMRMLISEPGAFDANGGHVWKHESIDYQPSELYGNGIPEGTVLRIKFISTPTPRLEFVIETFPNVTHRAPLMLPIGPGS